MGFDYLRFNLCNGFKGSTFAYLFEGFSENSDQKFDVPFLGHRFNLTYIGNRQKRIINFYHGPYHVFCLVENLDMGISRVVPYTFTFYGTYFYLPELQDCLVTFMRQYLTFLTVSRCDICLDVNIATEVLLKWKRTQFKFIDVIRNHGHVETFYLGRKLDNKKYFIRVYDKKIDSQGKGKFMLFHEYLSQETVTRIEAQINVLTCKVLRITPKAILEYIEASSIGDESRLHILEQWFASLCMNEQGTFFYSLRGLSLSNVTRLTTAKFTGRSKEIEKSRYVRIFLAYAKRLHSMGFDVFSFLREHLPPLRSDLNQQGSSNLLP